MIEKREVWVVTCPRCKQVIDFTGEGGIYFPTRKDALENSRAWLGAAGSSLVEICGCRERKEKA